MLGEDQFRTIIARTSQGLCVHQDGRLCFANPACARTFGHGEPADLVGRRWEELAVPEERPALRARAAACLRGEGAPAPAVWRALARDGSAIWVESTEALLSWEGRPAVLVTLSNFGARKALDEEYRQGQLLALAGRLAGGIAHDFNNVLTVITGYTDLTLQALRPGDPAAPLLTEVSRAVDRATALTGQLLGLSRPRSAEAGPVDLGALLYDSAPLLRRALGDDITWQSVLDPDACTVWANAAAVEQLLLTLVVHARDRMPGGGSFTLHTTAVEGAAVPAGLRPGRYVLLTVSGTARASPQAAPANSRETGPGLAPLRDLLRPYGGHVEVDTPPDRGLAARAYLPWRAAAAIEAAGRPEPAETPRGSETVLLVEDQDIIRELAGRILRGHGYTVLEVSHGEEALALCKGAAAPVHLLLTDLMMPQMGGRALAERLRTLCPGLKVLFLSGSADAAPALPGLASPPLLRKPFTAALARKVREVLDR
jgi:PAS domain S-box-containing protein